MLKENEPPRYCEPNLPKPLRNQIRTRAYYFHRTEQTLRRERKGIGYPTLHDLVTKGLIH